MSYESEESELARLCRYYLACTGYDGVEVSTFAQSKYGDEDYAELDRFPDRSSSLKDSPDYHRMKNKLRAPQGRRVIYLGYPTNLSLIVSRRTGWRGFMIEPLLLFPVRTDEGDGEDVIDFNFPSANPQAVRNLSGVSRAGLMEEVAQFEKDLGISDDGSPLEADDLFARFQKVRPEWPWRENIDPGSVVAASVKMSALKEEGVYNRPVFIIAESSPYTRGLEHELKEIARLSPEKIRGTALGAWLEGHIDNATSSDEEKAIIEVLPLNLEQKRAVKSSLAKSLTVITGPPGTGKSQVISNLLINATWQEKRVLFASKNNKAVDVVEERVNSLGPRPVLMRLGAASVYRIKLAEYISQLLATENKSEYQEEYDKYKKIHERLIRRLFDIDSEIARLVNLRNQTDKLEQKSEEFRRLVPHERFLSVRNADLSEASSVPASFLEGLDRADRERRTFLERMFWRWLESGRLDDVNQKRRELLDLARKIGLEAGEDAVNGDNISCWREFHGECEEMLLQAESAIRYLKCLKKLQSADSFEDLAVRALSLEAQIERNSLHLWRAWLRLQSNSLDASRRKDLAQYRSLLKMIIDSGDRSLPRSVWGKYYSLWSRVGELISCWAVTSLSARGRVPLQPGHFDIVIFDEASQCDIASALPLLYRAKAAVVIGDPRQLSHISGLKQGQDQRLLMRFGLFSERLEWAYSSNSLFDLASGLIPDSVVDLLDHHRSHADIIDFSNSEFYEEKLRVATVYENLVSPAKGGPGVRWTDVAGRVRRPSAGSAINQAEAEAVVGELSRLIVENGYEGSVGVVSPFRAQANKIAEIAHATPVLKDRLLEREFLSDTVHRFQGDERDVMIFSPVVSGGVTPGSIAFLRNNGNLFNVAVTRARAQLIVVGDRTACAKSDVGYLSRFAEYAASVSSRKRTKSPADRKKDRGPRYPSVSHPERVSDWEHLLYEEMYRAGMRPVPQYSEDKYDLDFALFDGERRLDIEVDGERYHRAWDGELCRRDQIRNRRLMELGWDVMRFWVYEIRDDMPRCIARIQEWLDKASGSDTAASN